MTSYESRRGNAVPNQPLVTPLGTLQPLNIDAEVQDARNYLVENFVTNVARTGGITIDGLVMVGRGLASYEYIDQGNYFDELDGREQNDLMFGERGNDRLRGMGGADVIYGGPDNDHIYGGPGNDTLYGGEGNDTYYINSSDGINDNMDRIEDGNPGYTTDESGDRVIVNGNPIGRFNRPTDGTSVWRTPDRRFAGFYVNNEYGTRDFLVSETNPTTLIPTGLRVILNEDFQEGDFGIKFYDELKPPANPESSNEIDGDLTPIDFNPEEPGTQLQYDQWGNVITDSQPDEGRNDILYDTPDNDLILAGDGNDYVRTFRGGSDWIKGEEGDDLIDGEVSINPIIEGGPGHDVLFGSYITGSQIFADSYGDMQTLIDAGETAQSTNEKGDFIAGGYPRGDNFVYGSNGNDILLSSGDKDLIVGAGGDDLILSDFQFDPGVTTETMHDWSYTIQVDQNPDGNTYTPVISGVMFLGQYDYEGDYDVIYAGTGNDYVESGGGDDEVHAGTGNDTVFGDAGDDWIDGGDGDDVLNGDNDISRLSADKHGRDYIGGGSGNDSIFGEGGADILLGGDGNDYIAGDDKSGVGDGDDYIDGGAGNDTLFGGGGDDTMHGGDDNDYLQRDNYVAGDKNAVRSALDSPCACYSMSWCAEMGQGRIPSFFQGRFREESC